MEDLFEKLLGALGRAPVEFIVVGGFAVMYAGYARTTEDVDLLVEASEPNLRRFLDALRALGIAGADELDVADLPLEEGSVRLVQEDYYLDLFTQMSGHAYGDLLPFTETFLLDGAPVKTLNAEGIILLKKDSLRPKDQLDVMALRDILNRRRRP